MRPVESKLEKKMVEALIMVFSCATEGALFVLMVGVFTSRLPSTCSLANGSEVPMPTFCAVTILYD
jgi:hypothetical protein